jgi:hypothetical protein
MSVDDKRIWRLLQHEIYRRADLDLTDTLVSVQRGVGSITGIIRPMPGVYLNYKDEMKALMDSARRIPGLRDLVIDARWEAGSKKG